MRASSRSRPVQSRRYGVARQPPSWCLRPDPPIRPGAPPELLHTPMPNPPAGGLTTASVSIVSDEQLDPGRRALLDLTLRRGVSDEQLAEILGLAADEIAFRRERAIEAVIEQSGIADLPVLDPSEE